MVSVLCLKFDSTVQCWVQSGRVLKMQVRSGSGLSFRPTEPKSIYKYINEKENLKICQWEHC